MIFHLVVGADLEGDLLAAVRVVELGDVDQPLDAFVELDEGAEVGHPGDLALDSAPTWCRGKKSSQMSVASCLMPSERRWFSTSMLEHDRLDLVALLEDLGRVLDPLGPGHVGDVHQAVDVLFDLDEDAEVGEVADLALDLGADRVVLGQLVQGLVSICFRPSEMRRARDRRRAPSRRPSPTLRIFDGMLDALAPRHLGDVDQPFDARLELDEGAVVGEADDLAADARTHRVALLDASPTGSCMSCL